MEAVERVELILRDSQGQDREAILTKKELTYTLVVNGETKDFIMVDAGATPILSLVASSTSQLVAVSVGQLNSTIQANVALKTPDGNELPLAVVKGDYPLTIGSHVIAFNESEPVEFQDLAHLSGMLVNQYYNHEIIGTIVKVQVFR